MAKEQKQTEKNEFEEKQPILEKKLSMSKDGNWLILRTIRIDIIHRNYLEKVLNKGEQ
ncbi:MAG: hypothetical protein KAI43_10090 [Candidatus Aureabacteria bacterium]|nr:hypothetical protein [Candidatus Auribacterota bacterium]